MSSIIWPGTDYSTGRHYTVLVGGSGLDERLVRVVRWREKLPVVHLTIQVANITPR